MQPRTLRRLLVAAATYMVLLHAVIGVLIWKADYAYQENVKRIDIDLAKVYEFPIDSRTRHIADGYYRTVDQRLRQRPLALLGDSLTELMPADQAIPGSLNLGLAGLTMRELTAGLARYPALDQAAGILLTIGINDFCLERTDEAEVTRRIGRLAAALPRNVPLVWGAIFPIDAAAGAHCTTPNQSIGRANAAIARACAALPACRYADSYGALADARGNLDPRYHNGDGIHLSPAGYTVWLGLLKRELAAAAASRESGGTRAPGAK